VTATPVFALAVALQHADGLLVGEIPAVQEEIAAVGLRDFDLPDVYRELHGYGVQESIWLMVRKGRTTSRRFDHIFASRRLSAISCEYVHDLRENGLSDHSAIKARFLGTFGPVSHLR
jgi:endonuclease/exonuclease/phosphatase family metal-dependent hydrolase